MKRLKTLALTISIVIGTLLTQRAAAQTKSEPMPGNGIWQIITNVGTPDLATVRFFDLEQHLIYEEHLSGVRLDANKRKTRKLLNKSLQAALVAWQQSPGLLRDKGLVAAQFGGSPAPAPMW